MRKSRFTEEQVYGVSTQSIYTRRTRFGTMTTDDVKRLKQLENENARLTELLAERTLELAVISEVAGEEW